jgi:branched-chain amino acid transport system ATP-binding protein
MSEFILETAGLTKEFKGFVAVSDVNLKVRRGDIHALIGPNGAGKTTVFNLLTKFLPPTAGTILFEGEDITREAPAATARRGLVRSFQISATFPNLTALENVRIGLQRKLGTEFHFWRSKKSLAVLDDQAMALLEAVDLGRFADTVTIEMPYGRKRALEFATTLALEPTMMLLDEPTQGMGQEDIGRVVEVIRKASANRTILMVEHNLSVVANLCHRITVLTRGSILAEGSYDEVSKNPKVLEAYVGSDDISDAHH